MLRQGARDRNALLLAAGKRIGALSGFVQETDAVEAIERQQSVAALETPHPAAPRRHMTEAAGKLQKAGVISYRRGHIKVLDRRKLEKMSCECYAVVRRETDRLLPLVAPH